MQDKPFAPDPEDPLTRGNLKDFALATLVGHVVIFVLNALLPVGLPALVGPIFGVVYAARRHVRERGGVRPRSGPMWTFAFGATGLTIFIQALLVFLIGPMLPKGEDALSPMAELGGTVAVFAPLIFILVRFLFTVVVRSELRGSAKHA